MTTVNRQDPKYIQILHQTAGNYLSEIPDNWDTATDNEQLDFVREYVWEPLENTLTPEKILNIIYETADGAYETYQSFSNAFLNLYQIQLIGLRDIRSKEPTDLIFTTQEKAIAYCKGRWISLVSERDMFITPGVSELEDEWYRISIIQADDQGNVCLEIPLSNNSTLILRERFNNLQQAKNYLDLLGIDHINGCIDIIVPIEADRLREHSSN